MTIRQLLTHTGGTGDFFGPEFDERRLSLKTHDDYVRLFGERAPTHPPGTEPRYSNYGFLLLGKIIEQVSGKSYYDYIDAHVFSPAGMRDSGSSPEEVAVPGRAVAYMRQDGAWTDAADTLPYRGTAAGGGYSTSGELAVTRWHADAARDCWGSFCYIRDARSDLVWSAAYQPTRHEPQDYRVIFGLEKVEFRQQVAGIATRMEISISPSQVAW